jgi:predicted CoA-substrate-specific enzyme activase
MATLGIDIGCISVKIAIVGLPTDRDIFDEIAANSDLFLSPQTGGRVDPSPSAPPILVSKYQRIKGSPTQSSRELLSRVMGALPEGLITAGRVTGTGGRLAGELLNLPYENEFKAVVRAIAALHPDVTTVFEMGGESSKFIQLDADRSSGRMGIVDYGTNGDCAAGTGSFMDQQANRLLYDIEDVGDIVESAGKAASIAGRCSVFAKSDMIHAQQKGYQPPEVLKGLCNAVVRNYRGTITKGKEIGARVAFIGGVAANSGAVLAVREAFEMTPEQLMIPSYFAWMGAIGSAMIAADYQSATDTLSIDTERLAQGPASEFQTSDALSMDRVILLRDRVKPYQFPAEDRIGVYLGIDIGSVSTNLVILDEAGEMVKEIYIKTEGRPVEVVNKGLAEIWNEMGPRLNILGVATTGSGRELIGELIGADAVNDEITAHKTGATFIGRKFIDRVPDTIFEIGGQDSKFISLQDGVVVDFAMNEACAAGTGSFLEEQAEKLGIKIIGEFAQLALSSQAPVKLGERCTVFMERDVNSYLQRGADKRDLVAGLAYSIAYNYLNRLVGRRHIGDTIYFQGGTAYNDSVAAAFSMILDRDIIVPPYNGVVGAIGAALMAREKMSATQAPSRFRGWDLEQVDYTVREFTCKGCSNACDIRRFTIDGERTYWGDKCSDRYRKRAKVDKEPVIRDLVALRDALLYSYVTEAEDYSAMLSTGDSAPRGTMGIPRSMYTYDRLPFWATFFKSCGFDVTVSPESNKYIREMGIDHTVSEPCFPIRVAHGHVVSLMDAGVDHIFLPNQLNEETDQPEIESHACPWGQTLPYVLRFAPYFQESADRIFAPTLHFRRGVEHIGETLRSAMKPFGVSPREVDEAVKDAYEAQKEFRNRLLAAGADALSTLEERGELGIVLIGRPYNIYDAGINMDIPAKLRKYYGVNVIPLDFLPLWGKDVREVTANMYWNYGRKILQAAKIVSEHPNLHIIYMTNFKCGPDSYIKHFVNPASPEPFLVLQFDEHTNDAGAMTRCEAYLDSKGFLRWWARDDAAAREPARGI